MKRKERGFSLIELLIVVAIILIIAAISVPNLLRAKMAANEASAVGSLRIINMTTAAFSSAYGNYPTRLSDLGPSNSPSSTAADLIDAVLVTGVKTGYRFTYTATSPYFQYTLTARPTNPGVSGQRYFFTDQTGVIRANTSAAATSSSTAIS